MFVAASSRIYWWHYVITQPEIVAFESRMLAAVHLKVPRNALQTSIEPAIQEVINVASLQGIQLAGPLTAYHHVMVDNMFDVDVGFPVNETVRSSGRVSTVHIAHATAIKTTFTGPYTQLFTAWQSLGDWFAANQDMQARGWHRDTRLCEVYVAGPDQIADPAAWRTELYMTVKR